MLAHVQARIRQARHVVVLTGAGMSQESGLPTYRSGDDGLWNTSIATKVATAHALRKDPRAVWNWHQAFAEQIRATSPNHGHTALAKLEQHCPVTIVTQNVDDLHERAGSSTVIHLHGSVFAFRCASCTRPMCDTPRCSHCNGHIRHDVVLFNEKLDASKIAQARKAIRECDVVLVIGTSNLIYPAAELPRYAMKRYKFVVEVNPQATPMSCWVSAHISMSAVAALQAVLPDDSYATPNVVLTPRI